MKKMQDIGSNYLDDKGNGTGFETSKVVGMLV